LIDEALQYALAVGNVESAVLLVEQNRYELMNSGQWRRLERWLGLFPASTVAQTPILLSTRAFLGIYFGQDKHILYFINESEHLLRKLLPGTAEYQTLQAEIDAVQSLVDMVYGRTTNAIACARRSLEVLPSQALYARSIATSMTSICLQMEGKLDQGVALIRDVLEKGTWPAGFHTLLELYLSIAYYQQGDLDGVLRTASEYLQFAEEHNFSESLCYGRYFLGIAHYLRNEFVHAEPYLLALLEDRAISAPSYLATGIFALALLYHATGRESEANQVIDLLSTHLREVKDTFGWVISEAIQVELALRQDNLEQARRLSIGVNFNKRPPYWFFYIPQLTHIKLLLAEGSAEDLEEAHARLDELDEAMRVIKRNNVRIDVLVLLALVCDRQGDESGAFENLSIALDLGSIGGNIRTFVDLGEPMANLLRRLKVQKGVENQTAYLRQLLAAFPEAPISPVPVLQSQLNDPLTDRELEVLSLLSRRLSNKEIAAELVISPRTVKRHTLNIYQKLDVNSRQQAVEKAAELEILAKTR
jgi:LuxR family maltose regulon positive regulatory protein